MNLIIIGCGRMGAGLAQTLSLRGHAITVVDRDETAFAAPRVIARVNNPKNAWMFTPQMGVDGALNQADLMARLIAEEMSLGDMMTLLKLTKGQYSLVEERVHGAATVVGTAIRDLALPTDCALAAIIRRGELQIPRADFVLGQYKKINPW